MLPKLYEDQDCSLARTLEIIGERWTMLVVRDAFYGVRRFGDFHTHLGIPKAVLADRLRLLTQHGLLAREADSEHVKRFVYRLTDKGAELWPAVHALRVWGEQHAPSPGGARRIFRHVRCGGQLDARGDCRRCRKTVRAFDVVAEPGPGLTDRPTADPVTVALRQPHRLCHRLDTTPAAGQVDAADTVHAG